MNFVRIFKFNAYLHSTLYILFPDDGVNAIIVQSDYG
jgi:hypothetical protein